MKRNSSQLLRRLRLEMLERRDLLTADLLSGDAWGAADPAEDAAVEAKVAGLEATFGTGAVLDLELFNVRTGAPATTVHVGDVLVARATQAVPATGGIAPSSYFSVFLGFTRLAYDAELFSYYPRAFDVVSSPELPPLENQVGPSGVFIAGEVGIGTLGSMAHTVPAGLTPVDPGRMNELLARPPHVAAYLASAVEHAQLQVEILDAGLRPVAADDAYDLSLPVVAAGDVDLTMTVSAAEGVLANDTAASPAPLRALLVDAPSHGRVELNSDGSFQYKPATTLNGSDVFSYVAIGEEGVSEVREVTIHGSYPPLLNLEVRTVSQDREPISAVRIGEQFFVELVASARDDSSTRRPISTDLTFAPQIAEPVGDVEFNSEFHKVQLTNVTRPDGTRVLESSLVPSSAVVGQDRLEVHVTGFRLEGAYAAEARVLRVPFVARAAGEIALELGSVASTLESHLIATASAILVVNPGSAWQNPSQPLDVNGDDRISPLDALVGINRLNSGAAGILPVERPPADSEAFFPDTNGDGTHSPLDVLLVVNSLNEAPPVAGAESTAPIAESTNHVGGESAIPVSERQDHMSGESMAVVSERADHVSMPGAEEWTRAPREDEGLATDTAAREVQEPSEDDPWDLFDWLAEDLLPLTT